MIWLGILIGINLGALAEWKWQIWTGLFEALHEESK